MSLGGVTGATLPKLRLFARFVMILFPPLATLSGHYKYIIVFSPQVFSDKLVQLMLDVKSKNDRLRLSEGWGQRK